MKNEIFNLFPTPLYKSNLGLSLNQEEYRELVSQPLEPNSPDFWAKPSVNRKVLDLDCFQNLKNLLLEHVQIYAKEIMGIDNNFYVTSSWLSVNKHHAWHQKHSHGNSILSGAFYIQVDESSSPLIFSRSKSITNNDVFQLKTLKENAYNQLAVEIKVSNYDLLIWPSWLPHEVPPNSSSLDRIVLSFNTFITGEVGFSNNSTLLIL